MQTKTIGRIYCVSVKALMIIAALLDAMVRIQIFYPNLHDLQIFIPPFLLFDTTHKTNSLHETTFQTCQISVFQPIIKLSRSVSILQSGKNRPFIHFQQNIKKQRGTGVFKYHIYLQYLYQSRFSYSHLFPAALSLKFLLCHLSLKFLLCHLSLKFLLCRLHHDF